MILIELQDNLFKELVSKMVTGSDFSAPKGQFYSLDSNITPFSYRGTVFKLTTDKIGYPITVNLVTEGEANASAQGPLKSSTVTIVPTTEESSFSMRLHRGRNLISAVDPVTKEVTYYEVYATTIVAMFEAFARVLYPNSQRIIEEQKRAIYTYLGTRLFEPYVPFLELMPEIQSLQIMSYRLLSRGLLWNVGTQGGVTDTVKALTFGTPLYKPMDKVTYDLEPSFDPWTRNSSAIAGSEAHVWIPNVGIAGWVAFLKYLANQPSLFSIERVTEEEVAFEYQGELQKHQFDFDAYGNNYLTALAQVDCFNSIFTDATVLARLRLIIHAAAYTFDLVLRGNNIIGSSRPYFDSGIDFDSGFPLDYDVVDPFSDGWAGLSLTGRFEQDQISHPLDSFIQESTNYTGPASYPTFYSQTLLESRADVDLDLTASLSGQGETGVAWYQTSPSGQRWRISIDGGALGSAAVGPGTSYYFYVRNPSSIPVAFELDDLGAVSTTTIIPPGAVEETDLYVADLSSGSIYQVTVDLSNTAVISLLF
jgi:hypothetical protein